MGELSEPFVVVESAESNLVYTFSFFAMGKGEGGGGGC